jgi:hypothetical protein
MLTRKFKFKIYPHMCHIQCCQLVEISSAKHNIGHIEILAAGQICGRIFVRFTKKGQMGAELFYALFIKENPYFMHHLFNLFFFTIIYISNL